MCQPSCRRSRPRSGSPRISEGRPGLERACTQSESPASGRRQPSACSVRLSASPARYSLLSPVERRNWSRSRLMRAIPCPRGEVRSSSSASSECRQKIRPLAASFPWRIATRPESSKPPGGSGTSGSPAHAPRNTAAAKPGAKRTTKSWQAVKNDSDLSVLQALDGVDECFVVGVRAVRVVPDPLGLVALAQRPEHFAEVSGDLGIGSAGERAAQVTERVLEVAHPVQYPAHAVDDERIVGSELQRALDQLARLGQPLVALGERIAERVVGVRVLGPDLDQLTKRSLENVDPLDFLGEHGVVVEQLGIVRKAIERLPDEVES